MNNNIDIYEKYIHEFGYPPADVTKLMNYAKIKLKLSIPWKQCKNIMHTKNITNQLMKLGYKQADIISALDTVTNKTDVQEITNELNRLIETQFTQQTQQNKEDLFNINLTENGTSNDLAESQLRLVEVIARHKGIFIDEEHTDEKDSINIVKFISQFHSSYSIVNFLDDFDQHTKHEQHNITYAENIYNKLITQLKVRRCMVENCKSLERNSSDEITFKLYGTKTPSDEEIVCHKILDSVHIYFLHLFDMGARLLKSERQQILENKHDENNYDISNTLSELMKNKINIYNEKCKHVNKNDTKSKFITIIPDPHSGKVDACFRESLMNELESTKIAPAEVKKVEQWFEEQEYDTDAINEDITSCDYNSNIKQEITCYEPIQNYFNQHNPTKPYYSFGFRYYYWTFFENNENEQNVIYTATQRRRSVRKQKLWYDPGNKGYKCFEWYIHKKYHSLKEEITHNEIRSINVKFFNKTVFEAQAKLMTIVSRRKKANNYWAKAYGIQGGSLLQLDHVICLLLYCNFSDLCFRFSETYRKINYYESNEALKRRHRNFYHFGKLLRELIEVYGTQFQFTSQNIFYHGVSQIMYFKNCYAKICGPMSTTISLEIAAGTFAQSNGLILHLQNNKALTFFMDCSSYSKFPQEMERLFIGGFSEIPFERIVKVKGWLDYMIFVKIISALNKMFLGHKNIEGIRDRQVKALKHLIAMNKNIDSYAIDLFHYYCINMKYMKLDMKAMCNNKMGISQRLHVRWYGYKPIYDIFFNTRFDIIDLHKLLKLFPNVNEVIIENWDITKYGSVDTNDDLSSELIEYILMSLTKVSSFKLQTLQIVSLIPMIKVNDMCAASHQLKTFIPTNDDYVCDRCNKKSKKNIEMYGCFDKKTKCNYSLCKLCFKTENKSDINLRNAIDQFQSKFKQISWEIQITKYKHHSQRISDSICFCVK